MIAQRYTLIQDNAPSMWKVKTQSYAYALTDKQNQEILAYHWHPKTPPIFPHFHLGAGASVGHSVLRKAHMPTWRVSLEDVIWMLINEFGVKPRRADWQTVLSRSRDLFTAWKSW